MIKQYIFIFIFLCVSVGSKCEPLNLKRLSVSENLSQNTVWSIIQDVNNKIWIGTSDGLNRYDGYSVEIYYHDIYDGASIMDSHVCSLYSDSEGTVWVGTLLGLSQYDYSTNTFRNFNLPGKALQVLAIAEMVGKSDTLLLGTTVGLMFFSKGTGNITHSNDILTDIVVNSICAYGDGVLIGTSHGLYYYSVTGNKCTLVVPHLSDTAIASVMADKEKECFWVGTQDKGIFRVSDAFVITGQYNIDKFYPYKHVNSIRTLRLYKDDKILVGTTEGLFVLNPDSGEFHNQLPDVSVRALAVDNQGGLWIGTHYHGVRYYHPFTYNFNVLGFSPGSLLNDRIVSCIVESVDKKGLWIGTNGGGVNYYDKRSETFRYYQAGNSPNTLKSNNIKSVLLDKGKGVYVGTHAGGLSYIDAVSGLVSNYTIPGTVGEDNSCYALLDNGDNIYVGAMTGLFELDKRTRKIKESPLANSNCSLKGSLVQALFKDSGGRIWIGTENGQFVYDSNRIIPLGGIPNMKYSLQIIANCFYEDNDKNVWVGSSNGLYKYDSNLILQGHYTIKDGLPNNFIYGILGDNLKHLWLSTNKGLAHFDVSSKRSYNYTEMDGLSHNEFNMYGYCKGSDGTFYFGTLDGITYFRPSDFIENPYSPDPEIIDLSLKNRSVIYGEDSSVNIQKNETGKLLEISFPYDQKELKISYTVSNYLSNRRNIFAYRLKGYEREWNYSDKREVTYFNLQPGTYVFQLKSCNNNGKWNESPVNLKIDVIPMWYQTWYVKLLFIMLCLSLIAWIMYFFIMKQKMKMQLKIELMEHKKMQEIATEKIRFYMNMSHELRTPLTLILGPLENMIQQAMLLDKKMLCDLKYVYNNALRLLNIINQLLDFRKVESGAMPLHIEMGNVVDLCKQTFILFNKQAEKNRMDYLFDSSISSLEIPVDKKYIETILLNLLSNSFKFTPDGGQISLTLWEKEDVWGFDVYDNGKGISSSKIDKIFERFYQANEYDKGTGIGLSLVKCLVEKHNGTISVKSKENEFTVFSVSLPKTLEVCSGDEKSNSEGNNTLLYPTEIYQEYLLEDTIDDGINKHSCNKTSDINILLVEDNKEMMDYLERLLCEQYNIYKASDGKQALDVVKENKIDIILSDVMMPNVDGIQLCKQIKRNIQTSHIPVVLLSAKSSVESQEEGINVGADDYIGKPFSVSLLKGKINNILITREHFRQYYANNINLDVAKMTSNTMDNEFLSKAISIIETNISDESFSAEKLAEELCISRSALYLKMNAIAGEAPANFIRRIRFNKACQLILENKYTIAEISVKLGFSSPSYFSNSFKRYVGVLPSEYGRKK